MIERMFDTMKAGVPQELAIMEPGSVLAGWLSAIDVRELSGHDRIIVLQAHQRMASHYSAHLYNDMATVTAAISTEETNDPEHANEAAAAEIRAALALTRRAADNELGFALDLEHRLPAIGRLLAAGDIDVRRAKAIVHGTAHLTAGQAREVTDRLIDDAPQLTTGQLTARIRRVCIDADPEDAHHRYRSATQDRRVVMQPTPEGTANLCGYDLAPTASPPPPAESTNSPVPSTPEPRAAPWTNSAPTCYSTSSKGPPPPPPGKEPSTSGPTSPHSPNSSAELAGYGPVIADIARQVSAQQARAQWRYTVTNPETGQVIHNGTTRRRPTPAQRRHIEARNPNCVFSGCRMPAANSDLDHRKTWSKGGPTTVDNLAPLCRHDHHIRHQAVWAYQPLTNGDYQWTSPLGHTYTTNHKPP